jgi:hypothetical protein
MKKKISVTASSCIYSSKEAMKSVSSACITDTNTAR